MDDLREGDWELDGVLMRKGTPVYVATFQPDAAELRAQDSANPFGDSLAFGRDYVTPPVWKFGITAKGDTIAAALEALAPVATAWQARSARRRPGVESVLRYRLGGRTRRVYGRPRAFTPKTDYIGFTGFLPATGDFATSTADILDDDLRRVDVGLTNPADGGFTFPAVFPINFTAASERVGVINDTGGDAPAPFTVTINGPCTSPVVAGSGWKIALDVTLAYDESVTVDTRTATVTRNDGASLADKLSRTARLADARLVAGGHDEFTFSAVDRTHTATATLSWRPAFTTI